MRPKRARAEGRASIVGEFVDLFDGWCLNCCFIALDVEVVHNCPEGHAIATSPNRKEVSGSRPS